MIGEGRLIRHAIDEPEELLAQFGNLGVYTLAEVRSSTIKRGERRGQALALHFDWYREAPVPLALQRIRSVLPSYDPITARRVGLDDAMELRRLSGWNVDTLCLR